MWLPVPHDWPALARSALVHAVSLARAAIIEARSGFESSPLIRARQAAELDALRADNALLREELRIKDARMARIPARERPLYPPAERLAILSFRAAAGLSAARTARRFLLTPATVATWTKRLDEHGEQALVRTVRPVNRFPELVAEIVGKLKATLPAMGKVRIANLLARAGIVLSASTVKRLAERRFAPPEMPRPLAGASTARRRETKSGRVVTARYPHHLWHVDLTAVPVGLGFWVPWLPFSLPLVWPFCFWVVVVLDHFTRSVVATGVFPKEPSAGDVCRVLDSAVERAGRAPRHIVSDQGPQFQKEYLGWCRRHGARARFGKIGEHSSIAIIERFFRSLKGECYRRIVVPARLASFEAELAAYVRWYETERPHQGLGGLTPDERWRGVSRERRVRFETRARFRARGDPRRGLNSACRALELRVDFLQGRRHLPVVRLRKAA